MEKLVLFWSSDHDFRHLFEYTIRSVSLLNKPIIFRNSTDLLNFLMHMHFNSPVVLFMDVEEDDPSGIEFLSVLRKYHSRESLPAVFLSKSEMEREGYFNGFLAKQWRKKNYGPVDIDRATEYLAFQLDQSQYQQYLGNRALSYYNN